MTSPEDSDIDVAFEQRFAAYLAQHPDYFDRHPELLEALRVPHRNGVAVSLVEKQIAVLREQLEGTRHQLTELIEVARDNDKHSRRLHELTLQLIQARDIDEAKAIVEDDLRGRFEVDSVAFCLFSDQRIEQTGTLDAEQGALLDSFQELLDKAQPVCGRLRRVQLSSLFAEQADKVRSAALLPLKARGLSGILALGSLDEDRFHYGQGTELLKQLGDVVSQILVRAGD